METYIKVYDWVLQARLTTEEKIVYCYIIRFSESGVGAFYKLADISRTLGIKEEKCKEVIQTLLDTGLVATEDATFHGKDMKVLMADMDIVSYASARRVNDATGRNSSEFVERFLKPYDGKIPTEEKRAFRKMYLRGNEWYDKRETEKRIIAMPYSDFMRTVYWNCVAREVKRRAGRTCEACGKKGGKLQAHHKTYENHGAELDNLGDLMCVCQECHRKLHNLGEK